MKPYSTVVQGRDVSKFIKLPDEFRESELKVVVKPIRKKSERFIELYMNPIHVTKITIPSREEINER